MSWVYSVRFHLFFALALCAAGTVACWYSASQKHVWWHWLANWLVVVNLITFGYYGLDKLLASRSWNFRIPERVLHMLNAVGGSPAALLAMRVFRHKTAKVSFRVFFWVIVVLQFVLMGYIVKVTYWN